MSMSARRKDMKTILTKASSSPAKRIEETGGAALYPKDTSGISSSSDSSDEKSSGSRAKVQATDDHKPESEEEMLAKSREMPWMKVPLLITGCLMKTGWRACA